MYRFAQTIINMTPDPYTQRWYRSESEVAAVGLFALVAGGCLAVTILADARSIPLTAAFLVIGVRIFIALAAWYRQRKGLLMKVFYVKHQAAAQIVGGVLQQKGLPFDRVNQLTTFRPVVVFNLPGDQIAVHVREYRNKYASGVRVEIGPVTKENRPLARSLQEKIDEAFAPQGLAR
jgi:hypothetical protein